MWSPGMRVRMGRMQEEVAPKALWGPSIPQLLLLKHEFEKVGSLSNEMESTDIDLLEFVYNTCHQRMIFIFCHLRNLGRKSIRKQHGSQLP